jgi:PAS domain S-box-containing protein
LKNHFQLDHGPLQAHWDLISSGFLAAPRLILLGSVAFLVYFTHWVDRSDRVLAQMNHAGMLMAMMEADFRGYEMAMQTDYLSDYIAARDQVNPELAGLETLVSDQPGQEALAVQFHSQVDEWMKYTDESLGHNAVKRARLNLQEEIRASKNLIAPAVETAKKITDNENELRAERYSLFKKSMVLTAAVFFLMAFTGIPAVLYRHRIALKKVGGMYTASLLAERTRAAELEITNERFRLLTAVVEVFVWTAEPNGEMDYVNEEGASFLGGDLKRDILGNGWVQYVHPDDISRVLHRWEESLRTGAPHEVEMRLRSRTGKYHWFLVRGRCIRNAQGVIIKWFGATTDIDALKNAQQSALDANRAKDVFLAALSHELRNPLSPALLVASEEVANPELPEPLRSSFDVILKSIEVEARLIDDLLDITRISSGKLALRKQVVDVREIFMDALVSVRPDQIRKRLALTLDWSAEKNEVNGDHVRLRQIFWNLLKNAVKFTPSGGSVSVKASNADSNVVIQVKDTGIGIKPEELSRLFNPFAQGDHAGEAGSHVYGGLGLGLVIAKNLVDMHGGAISAKSEGTGKGSTFTVEFPLAEKSQGFHERERVVP